MTKPGSWGAGAKLMGVQAAHRAVKWHGELGRGNAPRLCCLALGDWQSWGHSALAPTHGSGGTPQARDVPSSAASPELLGTHRAASLTLSGCGCPHQLSDQSDHQVCGLAHDFPVLWLLVALGWSQARSPPHHPGLPVASPVSQAAVSLQGWGQIPSVCALSGSVLHPLTSQTIPTPSKSECGLDVPTTAGTEGAQPWLTPGPTSLAHFISVGQD